MQTGFLDVMKNAVAPQQKKMRPPLTIRFCLESVEGLGHRHNNVSSIIKSMVWGLENITLQSETRRHFSKTQVVPQIEQDEKTLKSGNKFEASLPICMQT